MNNPNIPSKHLAEESRQFSQPLSEQDQTPLNFPLTAHHTLLNELKLNTLYESIAEGICLNELILSDQGEAVDYRIIDMNPAYKKIIGISPTNIQQRMASEILFKEMMSDLDVYAKVVTSGEPTTFETYVQPLDKYFHVSVLPLGSRRFALIYADITERKRTEEALKQTIAHLNSFINNIPDMAWLKDKESNFIAANTAFGNAVGIAPEFLVNHTCEICFGKEAAENFKADDRKVMESKQQTRIQESITDAQGKTVHLETIKSPILNQSGDVVGTVGIARDVTERKRTEDELRKYQERLEAMVAERTAEFTKANDQLRQEVMERKRAEQALRESEETSRALLDASPDATCLMTPDGVILAANKKITEIIPRQFDFDDVIGNNLYEILSPVRSARIKSWVMEAINSKAIIHQEDHQDGYWFENRICPIVTEEKEVIRLALYTRDITQRKKGEESLHENQELLRSILESTGNGILVVDGEGTVTLANRRFIEMWRISDGLLQPQHDTKLLEIIAEQLIEPAAFSSMLQQVYLTEKISFGTLCCKDGRVFEWTSCPLICDQKVADRVWCFVDITPRVQAEQRENDLREKLARAEKMESLGVLAGGIAHDLNNILGPMVALPDIIQLEFKEIEAGRSNLQQIKEDVIAIKSSAKRAAMAISNLVVFGRRGKIHRTIFNVNKVIDSLMSAREFDALRSNYPRISLRCKLSKKVLLIPGSESHLARILLNVVTNGMESIEKRGEVTISTKKVCLESSLHGYEIIPPGNYALIQIQDTGKGIDSQDLGRIFEPFYTRKKEAERSGSGLGLSVVHALMKDHAGFIDVKSAIKQGTTFGLYFPLVPSTKKQKTPREDKAASVGTEHLLIVDDEPGQRYIANRYLKKLGYRVTEVCNGHEAVRLHEEARRAGASAPFDLVLLDMIMEDNFDGLTTFEHITALYPQQRFIVMSGHTPESRGKAIQERKLEWISKPFELSVLAKAVRDKLDNKNHKK